MTSTSAEATAVFQRYLDETGRPDTRYYVVDVADLGPIWRALFTYEGARASWRSLLRLDKATGVVENDMIDTLRVGPSAKDTYDAIMRSDIAPMLRSLGLQGTRGVFVLPDPDHYATLSFQRSQGSFWPRFKFTANVSVIPRATWSDHARERIHAGPPHPNMHYGIGWQTRIGMLSRHGKDHWWEIWAGFPTEEIAADLCDALRLSVAAMAMEIEGTFLLRRGRDE